MAEGYNHELLKSEAEILGQLEQAIGEPLPSIARSIQSADEKLNARSAA
jgi:hypothetical protein